MDFLVSLAQHQACAQMFRASVWAPAVPCTLQESAPRLYQQINIVQLMRRQVEHNAIRYTGVELGRNVQIGNANIRVDVEMALGGEGANEHTLYEICLIDDQQGFAVNTELRGTIALEDGDAALKSKRIRVSILSSQKESVFNVTVKNLYIYSK